MAEFSCYSWSCHRNSECWSIFDINVQPVLRTDEVSGDVIVDGHCYTCCVLMVPEMCMTVTVVQTAP